MYLREGISSPCGRPKSYSKQVRSGNPINYNVKLMLTISCSFFALWCLWPNAYFRSFLRRPMILKSFDVSRGSDVTVLLSTAP
jgi:hypothetical protein